MAERMLPRMFAAASAAAQPELATAVRDMAGRASVTGIVAALRAMGKPAVDAAVQQFADKDRGTRAVELLTALLPESLPAVLKALDSNRAVIRAGWKRGRVHYDLLLDVNLGADRPSGDVRL